MRNENIAKSFQLYLTLLPELRATNEPAVGTALRELNPSEDRSEMPPSKWLDIEYHYRLTGSSQDNLPKLFLAGWTRSAPLLPSFIEQAVKNLLLSYRWSSRTRRIAFPPFLSGSPQTDVVRCRILSFQGPAKGKKIPSYM